MKINERCLPCLVNQVVKMTQMTNSTNNEELFHKVFAYMSEMDFHKTNPEIIGHVFKLVKEYLNNDDPYQHIRKNYNDLFLNQLVELEKKITDFKTAVTYAIAGNIIDFSPIHQDEHLDVLSFFEHIDNYEYSINDVKELYKDILNAKQLLYIGDNCGEICLDLLLIKQIKKINPSLYIYFATRGEAVVHDSIEEDAYYVGIDHYATIIHNGDGSLGTVLNRTSDDFLNIYHISDLIIAKGQANYESLSEEKKNIYFLLMVKCLVIANYLQVPEKTFVCLKNMKRI